MDRVELLIEGEVAVPTPIENLDINSNFFEKGRSVEKGIKESDVAPDQLAIGIQVEYEHTDSEIVSKKIALDHLAEIPDYYTRLKKMEEDAGIKD